MSLPFGSKFQDRFAQVPLLSFSHFLNLFTLLESCLEPIKLPQMYMSSMFLIFLLVSLTELLIGMTKTSDFWNTSSIKITSSRRKNYTTINSMFHMERWSVADHLDAFTSLYYNQFNSYVTIREARHEGRTVCKPFRQIRGVRGCLLFINMSMFLRRGRGQIRVYVDKKLIMVIYLLNLQMHLWYYVPTNIIVTVLH